jgi:hypothetical protein
LRLPQSPKKLLARLREEGGDAEGAERLRRFGLEADGSPALQR